MLYDSIYLGGYGFFVWPAFIFALVLCFILYNTTKKKYFKYEKLFETSSQMCWYLRPVIIYAIETTMRRSELLRLKWDNINLDTKHALLPITKKGPSRWSPLSSLTIAITSGTVLFCQFYLRKK